MQVKTISVEMYELIKISMMLFSPITMPSRLVKPSTRGSLRVQLFRVR